MKSIHEKFMQMAIELASAGWKRGDGGPFGAVIVKDGIVIGKGNNQVLKNNDPTAHAEVVAIREACAHLGHFQLDSCILYSSCEPCPMCLGAIYWARPLEVFFACTREDAAAIGFDDHLIYDEMTLSVASRKIPAFGFMREGALRVFDEYAVEPHKNLY
jgi:guanine deaminase